MPVYNIEVEGVHTYFIGKDGKYVLVHNDCWTDIFHADKSPITKAINKIKEKISDWIWSGAKRPSELGMKKPVKPTAEEQLDQLQTVIDTYGIGTPWGPVTDLANAGLYYARGRYIDAAFSAWGAIPAYGDSAQGGRVLWGLAKKAGKHADEVVDVVIDSNFKGKLPIGKVFPKEAMKELAKKNGWREVNGRFPHGEKVYYDPKNKVYITRDNTGHTGGSLKMAKKVEDLWSKDTRMGTYTPDMIRIGK